MTSKPFIVIGVLAVRALPALRGQLWVIPVSVAARRAPRPPRRAFRHPLHIHQRPLQLPHTSRPLSLAMVSSNYRGCCCTPWFLGQSPSSSHQNKRSIPPDSPCLPHSPVPDTTTTDQIKIVSHNPDYFCGLLTGLVSRDSVSAVVWKSDIRKLE